ncbi:uncharacterized protein [Rhodnius prolixus]|uniref:uncharacterized protein n=1 Tax=Rhodnius prolixus TaxID=13249 RepID=UPI003D18B536
MNQIVTCSLVVVATTLMHTTLTDVYELTPLVCFEDGIHGAECSTSLRKISGAPSEYHWLKERSIIQVQGVTESNIVYTNVSIIYKNSSEITQLYVEPIGAGANIPHWLVQPQVPQTLMFPLHVKLAFIPYDPIDVKRKSKTPYLPVESFCQTSDSKSECRILHNSLLVFKSLDFRTILLSLEGDIILEGLHVELLSAPCLLHCQLGISNCTDGTVNVTYRFWHRTSNNLMFENRSPNHYCVRVSPRDRCCNRCSENEVLTTGRSFVEKYDGHIYTNVVGVCLYFSIGFSLVCFVLWILYRGNCGRISYTATEDPSRLLPTAYQAGQHMHTDHELAMVQNKQYVEILLLYPKESETFQNLMDSFRNLLKIYVSKIWDPNDEECIELVCENWWQWLERVFKIPKLKVIVVETENCKEWLSKDFEQDSVQLHYLEGIFYYALARLKEDLLFCRDYTRLFRVRFDSCAPSERINLIVPFTCYEMPQHLSNLIVDLLGLRSSNLLSSNTANSKEKELLSEAMRRSGLSI